MTSDEVTGYSDFTTIAYFLKQLFNGYFLLGREKDIRKWTFTILCRYLTFILISSSEIVKYKALINMDNIF